MTAFAATIIPTLAAFLAEGESVATTMFSIDWSGVQTGINNAVDTATPIGIGVMVLFLGIRYVPRIIKSLGR